jgi:hypothetical protein
MMQTSKQTAVGESDGRCCKSSRCGKPLVRRPGERIRDFERRKTCDPVCKRAVDTEAAKAFRDRCNMSRSLASTYVPARGTFRPDSFQDDPRSKQPDGFLRILPAPTHVVPKAENLQTGDN